MAHFSAWRIAVFSIVGCFVVLPMVVVSVMQKRMERDMKPTITEWQQRSRMLPGGETLRVETWVWGSPRSDIRYCRILLVDKAARASGVSRGRIVRMELERARKSDKRPFLR